LTEKGEPEERKNGVKDEDKKNDSLLSFNGTFPLLNDKDDGTTTTIYNYYYYYYYKH
jgi:hypothetical protein